MVGLISGLFLLHGAVVVDKHKSAVIARVDVTLCAVIARAEITLWVKCRQGSLGGTFLGTSVDQETRSLAIVFRVCYTVPIEHSLPRTLGSVGRHQDMRPAQGIVSPMRDIVQYTVLHYNSMLMKMGEEEEGNGVWSSTLRKKFPDMREWEFNRWGAGYALDDTSPTGYSTEYFVQY